MKKKLIIVTYWIAAILATAFLLVSLDYELWKGIMIGMIFLLCSIALGFFLTKNNREASPARARNSIFIILGVFSMALFLIIVLHTVFLYMDQPGDDYMVFKDILSPLLINPVFIALILSVLAYGEYRLQKYLDAKLPQGTQKITFTSDYNKVTVLKSDILYIESRDKEVRIITRDGQEYRNRTGISQWENILGEQFLRIHRAFLVNIAETRPCSPETVITGDKELPVSRKYKESKKKFIG